MSELNRSSRLNSPGVGAHAQIRALITYEWCCRASDEKSYRISYSAFDHVCTEATAFERPGRLIKRDLVN
jgi:hypothetical protein